MWIRAGGMGWLRVLWAAGVRLAAVFAVLSLRMLQHALRDGVYCPAAAFRRGPRASFVCPTPAPRARFCSVPHGRECAARVGDDVPMLDRVGGFLVVLLGAVCTWPRPSPSQATVTA